MKGAVRTKTAMVCSTAAEASLRCGPLNLSKSTDFRLLSHKTPLEALHLSPSELRE